MRKLRLSCREKGKFETEVSKLTYRLDKSLFQTGKGKSARRHEGKQRAYPEIDRDSGR